MSYRTNEDNIYPVGTILCARIYPEVKLRIAAYNQRIYYCAVIGREGEKQLAYYERELVPPSAS